MSNFSSVKKFMEVFGQEVKTKAEFPPKKVADLRYNLIKEELDEFAQALKDQDLKDINADAFVSAMRMINWCRITRDDCVFLFSFVCF